MVNIFQALDCHYFGFSSSPEALGCTKDIQCLQGKDKQPVLVSNRTIDNPDLKSAPVPAGNKLIVREFKIKAVKEIEVKL